MIKCHLKVNKFGPDVSPLHMLSDIVQGSLKYLLSLLFILVVEIQILDGKGNIAFP